MKISEQKHWNRMEMLAEKSFDIKRPHLVDGRKPRESVRKKLHYITKWKMLRDKRELEAWESGKIMKCSLFDCRWTKSEETWQAWNIIM